MERPTLRWCCCEWMVSPLIQAGVDKRMIDVATPDMGLIYDDLCIARPDPLVHDVPNCGWHIGDGREWAFYATDTGTLDHVKARGYDLYLIEANYRQEELEARIAAKQAAGEFAYEYRAARNHLSEEQAINWLAENIGPNSQYVYLHQHQDRKKKEE